MATFTYEALNEAGKPQKGTIEATSKEEAVQKIKSQRLFPTEVKETKGAKKEGGEGGGDAPLRTDLRERVGSPRESQRGPSVPRMGANGG